MGVATLEVLDRLELRVGVDPEQRGARAELRRQVARLEERLGLLAVELWESGNRRPLDDAASLHGRSRHAARLLTIGELEAIRDALVGRVRAGERVLESRSHSTAAARARLEGMLADPSAHRFEIVYRSHLGEPGCGAYHALPRLGLLGMLFGWWCVKLSSGCP
jgi:hypothetical protein